MHLIIDTPSHVEQCWWRTDAKQLATRKCLCAFGKPRCMSRLCDESLTWRANQIRTQPSGQGGPPGQKNRWKNNNTRLKNVTNYKCPAVEGACVTCSLCLHLSWTFLEVICIQTYSSCQAMFTVEIDTVVIASFTQNRCWLKRHQHAPGLGKEKEKFYVSHKARESSVVHLSLSDYLRPSRWRGRGSKLKVRRGKLFEQNINKKKKK